MIVSDPAKALLSAGAKSLQFNAISVAREPEGYRFVYSFDGVAMFWTEPFQLAEGTNITMSGIEGKMNIKLV